MTKVMTDYGDAYNEKSLWEKIKKFAKKIGREGIEKVLILYFCLKDPDTPAWAKTVIIGALGYFIVPTDAIPDFTPIVGFSDDIGVLAFAFATVAAYVKPAHKDKAREKINVWFDDEEEEEGK